MAPEAREDLTDNAPELSNLPLAGSSIKLFLEAQASQDSRAEAQALAREISGNGRVPKHHCETLASLLGHAVTTLLGRARRQHEQCAQLPVPQGRC